jgi:hypothetical protein
LGGGAYESRDRTALGAVAYGGVRSDLVSGRHGHLPPLTRSASEAS